MSTNLTPIERFISKINFTGACWLWTGFISPMGYGRFWMNGAQGFAHRAAYTFWIGPIPDTLTIDHLCRVHACVNPDHLDAVPNRVNVLRGEGPSANNWRKTHCLRGHAYTDENTYSRRDRPNNRQCRACMAIWNKRERHSS